MFIKYLLYSSLFGIVLLVGAFFIFHKTQVSLKENEVGIPISQKQEVSEKTTVLIFGDVMLDRSVRNYIDLHGTEKLFEYVRDDIVYADLTVVNLEGPITEYNSVVSKENLQFTFATHTAHDLGTLGIDVVSLANNHTNNFGLKGLEQTKKYLGNAGIIFFGHPSNKENEIVYTVHLGSSTLSFIGYHQFDNPSFDPIQKRIQEEKEKGNFVVLYPHWGTEYQKEAGKTEQNIAHSAIDAGAHIIIGAHPHVVQNIEVYKNAFIFYSLGNFIFDQWFTFDVQEGLALLLTFDDTELFSIELKPFIRERYQPKWLEEDQKTIWCKEYTKNLTDHKKGPNPCVLHVKEV